MIEVEIFQTFEVALPYIDVKNMYMQSDFQALLKTHCAIFYERFIAIQDRFIGLDILTKISFYEFGRVIRPPGNLPNDMLWIAVLKQRLDFQQRQRIPQAQVCRHI
ncbi:hypothetical protein NS331_06235 [Pseudacidovorax intermedius]|uniref:Uncharacterized protein n=1 Tax=Pseudacidovorax intermedius TaxID=433924 RepID=A0A147H4H2_9BURK|nr:hypothetical protein NS331_06235 [Pseudacidovorax intermedius]